MRKGMRKKSFLLCFLLVITMVFSGCQSSAAQAASEEDQVQTASSEEPEKETEGDSQEEDTGNTEEEQEAEQEYIDEAYVDENYGEGQEEDLSKYKASADTSRETDSSGEAQSSGEASEESTEAGESGSQNGVTVSEEASAENYYTDPIPEGMPQPVEPQDAQVNTDSPLTCTLLVEGSTSQNNMENLTEGKESLVPSDGVIYDTTTVTFYEGESVYDVLLREMQNSRIHMESSFSAMYNSVYVEGINNLYEFDCGRWSGWMYCVNGWYPNYGCSRYQVQQGDVIEWHYTCDLGRDLGRDASEWQQ